MGRADVFRLMLVTDRRLCEEDPASVIERALQGGPAAIQLRENDLPSGELLKLAGRLRRITREAAAPLIVNHRPDIAIAVGADGVHLGWRSLAVRDVRKLAGNRLIVGVSCHDAESLRRAEADGADYAVLGPVYPTPSKAGLVEPLGPAGLRKCVEQTELPVIAIGGITPGNAGEAFACGATGVAAIRSLLTASDPATAVRRMLSASRDRPLQGDHPG